MAKDRSKPITLAKKLDPDEDALRREAKLNLAIIALVIIVGMAAVVILRQYIDRNTFPTDPPAVSLVNRPTWMSDFLAEQIAATARPTTAHSTFDQQMLKDAYEMLKTNPWIKEVRQVRRAFGKAPGDILEIDCDYRTPIALVQWGDYFSLVDVDGVRLPEQFTYAQLSKIMFGQDGRMNIRIIDGVQRPPPQAGRKWVGEDLAAALSLVKTLYGQPFAEDIRSVRASNFGGRIDPKEAWLVCITRDQTEIRWGRAKDDPAEVSIAQKLDYLRRIIEKYHRADANHSVIDLRFDRVTFPSDEDHHTSQTAVGP